MVGDVVGCSIDLDENTMSFFLNGYGEEVGMGLAFRDVDYTGGMFPGLSFNKLESVQVNLGYKPFKHPPPKGHEAFSKHIDRVIAAQSIDKHPMSPSFDEYISDEHKFPSLVFEDCLEDSRDDVDFNWKRRYFTAAESSGLLSSRSSSSRRFYPTLASSNVDMSKNSVEDKLVIEKRLAVVAGDLCILYTRLALLKLLSYDESSVS